MRIDYVKTVTYTCPVCDTSIKFSVDSDRDAMRELYNAVDNLICPKCKENLSYQARSVFNAITSYNNSAKSLLAVQKESGAILD